MGVICSGPQNSGTYLLTKCVELMGFERLWANIDEERITRNEWDRPNLGVKDRIWDASYKAQFITLSAGHRLNWINQNLKENYCIHAHNPSFIEGHKNVFILRDPRNMLVSRLRRRIKEDHPSLKRWGIGPNYSRESNFLSYIKKTGKSVVEKVDTYLRIEQGFRVYYESLKHPATLRNLAQYLETDRIPTEEELYGHTITWSGHPSEYQKWWGEDSELVFESVGGNDLIRRMGYEPARS